MTSINDRSSSPRKVVLRNLTNGAPWQAELFELAIEGPSFKSLKEEAEKGGAVGFGSKVIGFSKGRLREVFLAVYFLENEWIVFDGCRARALGSVSVRWSVSRFNILGAGIATLHISDDVESESVSYFRPWLRHWFEDGWSLDDVDIGWVVGHLASNADAKVRLLEALSKC